MTKMKAAIRILNTTSKISSLVATFSTIFPIQHTAVTYAGYGGAACSLLTKVTEETLRHTSSDNVREYGKSAVNAANRLFLLAYLLLDILPNYGLLDKDQDLTPYKLSLAGLWGLMVIVDFLIKDPVSEETWSDSTSIELHTFSSGNRYR